MTKNDLYQLNIRLRSLAIFRNVLSDPVMKELLSYLDALETGSIPQAVSRYSGFAARLYADGCPPWSKYVEQLAGDDENPYIRLIGRGQQPRPEMVASLRRELDILQAAAELTPAALGSGLDWDGTLPGFPLEAVDIPASYRRRCENIAKMGYGIYARHRMFCVSEAGQIQPVRSPDPIRLSSLIDYRQQQQVILDNTLALLAGKPAANILLTGDAGTGKSSTIKAVVNELAYKGLRILEVRKEQLHSIPGILDELSGNPLKFILFIDDLSFQKDDDNFSALKAILEGGVSAKSRNVVIYATSNRRHLVKETFSGREGDDIHRNDTMQELLSLSERFGIQLTFQKPDKNTYLDIVRHLAEEAAIAMPREELELLAERYALGRGGRSARAARQFVDSLLAKP